MIIFKRIESRYVIILLSIIILIGLLDKKIESALTDFRNFLFLHHSGLNKPKLFVFFRFNSFEFVI